MRLKKTKERKLHTMLALYDCVTLWVSGPYKHYILPD